ncbi:acyl-CoA-binding protein [Photobacterium proteolyticum]|uniref:Acyl-CoA-binding protein n=2 Tax=Photobacterium TaxID=657 RepID=A0A1Q9H131_9GAMM|nr:MULTISPECIES: acyl-CoA-binding protein [Photobacterium]MCG7588342.1 acyl-CoA-binding protein [Photobacterium sp. OFAV2-7]NBI51277.1 acyl-CoA-binding protein [Photobacterium alginatilyticum]OLQ81381.1 acyl-CoA-binding protein [Photobacterium proteolyticum]
MADLKENFEQAQLDVKKLTKRPSNEELLALYSLYKQATDGDVHGKRPGMFDFKGAAKYEAWEGLKGMDAETAMQQYVDKVTELTAAYA